MRHLPHVVGWLCLVFGTIGALASLWFFLDPVGAHMATHPDPFGAPPREQSAFAFVFCLAGILFGLRSIRRSRPE